MADGLRAAHIQGKYAIVVAVIGVVGTLVGVVLTYPYWGSTPESRSDSKASPLTIEKVELIPQPANQKTIFGTNGSSRSLGRDDKSTIRLVVSNNSNRSVAITMGEFVVDDVKRPFLTDGETISTTLAIMPLIEHKGHIEAQIGNAEGGRRDSDTRHALLSPLTESARLSFGFDQLRRTRQKFNTLPAEFDSSTLLATLRAVPLRWNSIARLASLRRILRQIMTLALNKLFGDHRLDRLGHGNTLEFAI